MILYGPPGTGKTTLARMLAEYADAAFEELSAVEAGRAEVREVMARARERRRAGRHTIFFLDEIHRFNKAQQDALLPAVEEGLVVLVGATTENPYFEVNSALISRTQVYELHELTRGGHRRAAAAGAGRARRVASRDEVIEFLAARSGGDARSSLNALELALDTAARTGEPVTLADAEDAMQRKALRYDKAGDQHYDYISAWIKSTRGSDPDASLYYLAAMLEGGEDARFIARRMVVLASEDVGNADPQALHGRGRRGARRRARRAAGVHVRARPGGDLPRRWRRSPTPPGRRSAPPGRTSASTARRSRRPRCARPRTRRRGRSAAGAATTTRTTTRATSTTRSTCPRAARTCASTTPATPSPSCASGSPRSGGCPRPRTRERSRTAARGRRSRCGRCVPVARRARATSGGRRWRCSTSSTTSRCGWPTRPGWPRAQLVLPSCCPPRAGCARWPTTGRARSPTAAVPRAALLAGRRTRLVQSPVGVIGLRGPSASPWAEPALEAAAALLAGNGVILAAARRWPRSACAPCSCARRAGRADRRRARGQDLDAVCRRVVDLPRPARRGTLLVLGGAPRERSSRRRCGRRSRPPRRPRPGGS